MIDAYTIGIRLALDDGVSAGLAVIQAKLTELDRGISSTTIGLQQLSELGQTVTLAQQPPLPLRPPAPGSKARTAPVGYQSAPESESAPNVRPSLPPQVSRPVPPQIQQAKESGGAFAPSRTGQLATEKPRNPQPTRPSSPESGGAASISLSSFVVNPLDTYMAPDSTTQEPGAAFGLPASPEPVINQPQVPQRGLESTAAVRSGVQPQGRLNADDISREALALPRPNLVIEPIKPLVPPRSSAPVRPSQQEDAKPSREAMGSGRPASVGDPGGAQPVSGEVLLDGIHLGRWIADTLATAVSRPPSGFTGFDPRIGPSWPGMPGG